ncbi:MAG: ATP-binding protein [Bacteroidales bacterium]|nr:ATP-binding protein [Bacteroidales bacterium]MDD3105704.1 ATP-binding protein [Bacteroidales bacterium]NCD09831.1 ATP-binding protein [Negativicutes bacterium]HPJ55537.1 ATP-binding protein [Bacteroidales bacterium]
MIQRALEKKLLSDIKPQKVVLLLGARRVGKTVLMEKLIREYGDGVVFLNGEDYATVEMLSARTISSYKQLFQGVKLLAIDEAQNIPHIGNILKLIIDHIEGLSVIVSGSSSFDLYNMAGEPLVGRSNHYMLYPFSLKELSKEESGVETMQLLEERLVYGMYPELIHISDFDKKKQYLLEVVNSYLLKDILMIDGIKNSSKMRDLLRLVAFQMGSEVSYDELARQLGLSRNTVEKYLDLLSKIYVIHKLPAFSQNKRKEVTKSSKWYFTDNGIRNAVINDFRVVSMREDVGLLWESFLIGERMKKRNNANEFASFYFWRSYSMQEIDLIEEFNGTISAFEFKWNNKKVKTPSRFVENYPHTDFNVINKINFWDFIK